ncbi:CRISPR-associated endoribonuclease Cas6 [Peptostreptococcus anaerobius]|nr:CRISPR-associated endoribonuclease Cas6 [Peptostreptococcus anaerobius]
MRRDILRLKVEFELSQDQIYKDKNKMLTSWIKHFMAKYDSEMYKRLYKSGPKEKDYTFSVYMGNNVKFSREMIEIPDKRMIMYFSSYDLKESMHFYNIFLKSIGESYDYKELKICSKRLYIENETKFIYDNAYFKSASPVIIREHRDHDNSKTYYHDLGNTEGLEIMKRNLTNRLLKKFGDRVKYDVKNISIEVMSNKIVTVRHHGINIPSNLCRLKITAKPYILEYVYYTGILSSLNASGYGMLNLVK